MLLGCGSGTPGTTSGPLAYGQRTTLPLPSPLATMPSASQSRRTCSQPGCGHGPARGRTGSCSSMPCHMLGNVVTEDDLTDAEGTRRDRALAEYGDYPSTQFSADHVNASADVAERIVNAVASELSRLVSPKRS
jgi:hypothetical protein